MDGVGVIFEDKKSTWKDFSVAFNPLQPNLEVHHHPIYYKFKPYFGPWDRKYIYNFLGLKMLYRYDCGNTGGYRAYCVSRSIPCDLHDRLVEKYDETKEVYVQTQYPIVDEEYFEFIDALYAACTFFYNFGLNSFRSSKRLFRCC